MSKSIIRQVAEDVLEIDIQSAADAQIIARALADQGRWLEVVPGLASVSVLFDPAITPREEVARAIQEAATTPASELESAAPTLPIPVRYGGEFGPDLADVCDMLGMREVDFIRAHISASHRVDMIGFTPGFAYVSGIDASLSVPRRRAPRPCLPAGSVGISGEYTGLYALSGPGGWPIIGRADMQLFDPDADEPFRIQPGQRIAFAPV